MNILEKYIYIYIYIHTYIYTYTYMDIHSIIYTLLYIIKNRDRIHFHKDFFPSFFLLLFFCFCFLLG